MSNIKTIILVAAILGIGGLGSVTVVRLYQNQKESTAPQAEDTNSQEEGAFEEEQESEEDDDYYGSSTLGDCNCSCKCVVSGCNGEICQSEDEESMGSICVIPDKPTPDELGYSCQCVNNQCQWAK